MGEIAEKISETGNIEGQRKLFVEFTDLAGPNDRRSTFGRNYL